MVDAQVRQAYEEAQKGLVSTLLYVPGHISDVAGIVSADDFSDGTAKTIYTTMVELNASNRAVDYPNIVSELLNSGHMVEAGGIETVERYFNEGAQRGAAASVEVYAQVIKNVASKERLGGVTKQLMELTRNPHESAYDIIEEGKKRFDDELMALSSVQDAMSIAEYADEYRQTIREKIKKYDESKNPLAAEQGIPSSLDAINKYVGGWQPGQLDVIGARTGVGKSFFLVQEALSAATAGCSVLFFSLEMLYSELMDRFVSSCTWDISNNVDRATGREMYPSDPKSITPVKLSFIKHGELKDQNRAVMVDKTVRVMESLNITIDTTPNITLDHIRAKAQQQMHSSKGLNIIFIDYLQLVQPPRGEINRERQVAEISRGLKLLSMQLGIPIIVAVQLNRLHKGDEDPLPTINDIRESNAIAQDASVIVLIHRDTNRNSDGEYDPATFIIGKNRNGSSGIRFKCKTMLNYARFENITDDFNDDEEEAGHGEDPVGADTGPTEGNGPRLGDMSLDDAVESLNQSPMENDMTGSIGNDGSNMEDDDDQW